MSTPTGWPTALPAHPPVAPEAHPVTAVTAPTAPCRSAAPPVELVVVAAYLTLVAVTLALIVGLQ